MAAAVGERLVDPATKLPEEMMCNIFGFLDRQALGRCCRVTTVWKEIASHQTLWDRHLPTLIDPTDQMRNLLPAARVKEMLSDCIVLDTENDMPDMHQAWADCISLHSDNQLQYILYDPTKNAWRIQHWELRIGTLPPEEEITRLTCYVRQANLGNHLPTRLETAPYWALRAEHLRDGQPNLRGGGLFPIGRPQWQHSYIDPNNPLGLPAALLMPQPPNAMNVIVERRIEALEVELDRERAKVICDWGRPCLYYGSSAYIAWCATTADTLTVSDVLLASFYAGVAGNIRGLVSQGITLGSKTLAFANQFLQENLRIIEPDATVPPPDVAEEEGSP